jgi:hypothetical protein
MKLKDIFVPVNSDYARNLREGDILYTPTSEQLEMEVAEDILAQVRETRVGLSGITGKLSVVYEVKAHGSSSTELDVLRNRHGVYRKLAPGEKPEESEDTFKLALEVYLRSRAPKQIKAAEAPDRKNQLELFLGVNLRYEQIINESNSSELIFAIERDSSEVSKQVFHDLRDLITMTYGKTIVFRDLKEYLELEGSEEAIRAVMSCFIKNINVVGPERSKVYNFEQISRKKNDIVCKLKRPQHKNGNFKVKISFKYSV